MYARATKAFMLNSPQDRAVTALASANSPGSSSTCHLWPRHICADPNAILSEDSAAGGTESTSTAMVFSRLFPSEKSGGADSTVRADPEASDSEPSIIHDGDLAYTRVKGGNGSKPSYQEAVGAPVEADSPLGYHVNWVAIIFLNINMMVGTGVFSTRKLIWALSCSCGKVVKVKLWLLEIYWILTLFRYSC